MRGKNPIRPPVSDDGSQLGVKNIFATLQGEGPHVGIPSVFIRLGGCNLACDFCDAEFEGYDMIPITAILHNVHKLSCNNKGKSVRKLVVITGGEPFRQNITPLCDLLLANGFNVQIETNGTLYREIAPKIDIVCSPKNTGIGYTKIRGDLLARVSAIKFIISASDEKYKNVGDIGQDLYNIPVYVQPMDEADNAKNAANKKLALELAMQYGYRLSLQTQKILKID